MGAVPAREPSVRLGAHPTAKGKGGGVSIWVAKPPNPCTTLS